MVTASTLTIAEVSGLIAAGIVIVKLLLPNLVVLSFLGSLKERDGVFTTNALSWSVIGKELHSSLWPSLLQSDSVASRGVLPSVNYTKWTALFATILAAVAAIVTPLGLYEDIVLDHKPILQTFHYINDTGLFGLGQGTQPRNNTIPWSRICGGYGPFPCPETDTNMTTFTNATGTYFTIDGPYDTTVHQSYIDLFQSGVAALGDSVSGPFDIQWRSLTWALVNNVANISFTVGNNLTTYPIGAPRQISSLALDNKYEVVEGLVVDTENGGVGFRNHTAPPFTTYGSTWQEDLLFIEPVTECVDTNLTFDYEIPEYMSQQEDLYMLVSSFANLRLVDHGGFVNINKTFPEWDRALAQENPELWQRAYKGAWLNNVYSMAFMGVTNLHQGPDSPPALEYINSTLGKEFLFQYENGLAADVGINFSPQSLSTILYGWYLNGLDQAIQTNATFPNGTANPDPTILGPLFPNPYNVTNSDFGDIDILCEGEGGQDYANATNFAATCSLVLGTPHRKDGVVDLMGLPGSTWTTPMYNCISIARATIKTVTFAFNNSNDLNGLTVTDIQPKQYANTSEMPIWAVEDLTDVLANVLPLWGIVSPEHVNTANISTLQSEHLILPGYTPEQGLEGNSYQNLPAIDAPGGALATAYDIGLETPTGLPDYTGRSSLAMFRRWQNLSSSASTMGTVFNLIFTDLLANTVVGTKSLIQPSSANLVKRDASPSVPQFEVTQWQSRIKYRLPYMVPAVLLLTLLLASILATVYTVVTKRTSAAKMRRYLNATSAGRLMTLRSGIGKDDEKSMNTSSWMDTDGGKRISAGNGGLLHLDSDGQNEGGKLLKNDEVQIVESERNQSGDLVKDASTGSTEQEVASPTE